MAIKINFDSTHNAYTPTLILATRSGDRIDVLPAYDIKVRDVFNGYSSFECKVNYEDCAGRATGLWDKIVDFRLVYCREFNRWFEISVDTNETEYLEKTIVAKSLGEAELSQILLFGIEVNTETDISRDEYVPTVFYNEENAAASLLHRITEKSPNYRIVHVDSTLKSIQRSFTFNDTSIYDAMMEISDEIGCIFVVDAVCDNDGRLCREIKVYDLESYCVECGERSEFDRVCPKCGSTNVISGYGRDTSIFVSARNLADNIRYTTDVDSVKNCFKLSAGDDLMDAAITSCNPNGSPYIWCISESTKEDMSAGLVERLREYDEFYNYYQNEHRVSIPEDILNRYNAIVDKYASLHDGMKKLKPEIVGYPALMNAQYDTIDLNILLEYSLAPKVDKTVSSAEIEAGKLTAPYLSPVAVQDISHLSVATASSAVLAIAKIVADSTRYQIKVKDATLENNVWTGSFTVKSYADEEDVAESAVISVVINDDYKTFVEQKLERAMKNTPDNAEDISDLFKMEDDAFKAEISKYALRRLMSFRDTCQMCLDVMVEQGVASNDPINGNVYDELYKPMYDRLVYLDEEIKVREDEISVIVGKFDADGDVMSTGIQNIITDERETIQKQLNMQNFFTEDEWLEFVAYRREDTYQNDNYISDGLNNAELFERAMEFVEAAKKEIFKSANLQHSISATLKNLLVMKEFAPLVDNFETGNWIRIEVDNAIYRLRLIEYQVDYSNLQNISVVFSDVKCVSDGVSDLESILNQASSMASSFSAVTRQANQGNKSANQLEEWVSKGLALTNMKIVSSADNQNVTMDSHGLSCKEYVPVLDRYDPKQLKVINRGLYLTDDNWLTARAGIGDFTFYNPMTGKVENSYGVIADTLVGNLILSEKVGIYNTQNSVMIDEKGMVITALDTEDDNKTMFKVRKKNVDEDGNTYYTDHLYLDENGNLVINGTIRVQTGDPSIAPTLDEINKKADGAVSDIEEVVNRINGFNGLHFYTMYSPNNKGIPMTPDPQPDSLFMGTCSTDAKTAPTDPSLYTWVLVKGDDGIPGVNSYIHIKYSNNNGDSFTDNNGEDFGDYIGICVTESQDDPDDPNMYSWRKFVGEDAITHYTWIKYADTPTSGMSDNPEGKKYIGIAYNKTEQRESNDYSDYAWSIIQGDDGISGLNSSTVRLHMRSKTVPAKPTADITYNFADGSVSGAGQWRVTIPDGTDPCYVIQATAVSREASDVIASTEWSDPVIMVESGVNSATVYLYRRSATPVAVDWTSSVVYTFDTGLLDRVPNGWSQTIPAGEAAIYVTAATASSAEPTDVIAANEWSSPVILAENGKKYYTWMKYADDKNGSGISDDPNGKLYIGMAYNKESPAESNDPADYTWALFRGADGIPGINGAPGTTIVSITEEYYLSTSKETCTGGSWKTTAPTWSYGKYIWTRSKIVYANPDSTDYTTPLCDSSWEAVNEIEIGGRNLALNTSDEYTAFVSPFNGNDNICPGVASVLTKGLSVGDTVMVRLEYEYKDIVSVSGANAAAWIQGSGDVTAWQTGSFGGSSRAYIDGSGTHVFEYSFTVTDSHIENSRWSVNIRHDKVQSGSVRWKCFKVERGNKHTAWTPAPEDVQSRLNESAQEFVNFVTQYNADLGDLQYQIEGSFTSWFFEHDPALNNEPASEWTTDKEKDKHLGNLFYNTENGYCYRFMKADGVYSWCKVTDTGISKAMEDAKNAKDIADSKRRVFYVQPTPPYDQGDLWVQGENGDIMRCQTAKDSGSYAASDWVKASKYTDDTQANAAMNAVNNLEIGGRNLIRHSYIKNRGCSKFEYDSSTNTWSCIAPAGSTNWGYGFVISSNGEIEVPRGRTFIISFEINPTVDCSFAYDVNNGYIGNTGGNDNDITSMRQSSGNMLSANIWTKCWFSYTARSDVEYDLYDASSNFGVITTSSQLPIEFKVRNIKGEYGNKPTDWTPAPEDVQSDIGTSVASTDVEYYLSTSKTSLAGGSWQTTAPDWVNGKYMWSRTKVTLKNGTVSYSPSANGTCIAGAKGDSVYFHVRYSANKDGSQMTLSPQENTKYMGVCSTTTDVPPSSYTDYAWYQCKGNDGMPGKNGEDGRTQYLHIKYSDNGQDFTANEGEDLGAWIGTRVDFVKEDSRIFTDYTWKKFTEDVDDELQDLSDRIQETNDKLTEVDSGVTNVRSTIDTQYDALSAKIESTLKNYKAEVGQYMYYDESGLQLGSTGEASGRFKTVIDNTGIYFKQDGAIISYINNNQLHIPNAVIEETMMIGHFFFSPHSDGSVSITWQ